MKNTYIEPAWSNAITICVASSDLYAKYLSVLLASIKSNASDHLYYDIIVLHHRISDENQEILTSIFSKSPNISLRFFNPIFLSGGIRERIKGKYKQLLCKISRISAPIIFRKYERIIFTDLDAVFNTDPIELYNQDMQGKPVLATLDPMRNVFINTNSPRRGCKTLEHSTEVLNLRNPKLYFNVGVMLLDVGACLSYNLYEKCINAITRKKTYLWTEQDVMNEVLGEDMGVLPPEWNWETIRRSEAKLADQEFAQYCEMERPKVIHFIARHKPWIAGPIDQRHRYWWKYARISPYYGELVTQSITGYIGYIRKELDKMSLRQVASAIEEIVGVVTDK